jgi:hypothetical protein
MANSKIIPNISTFNFDYRVCRHYEKNKKGQRMLIDGEPVSFLQIHEIHFGAEGEIVAYIEKPEVLYGDDLEDITAELEEYKKAIAQPILDFDFVIDQTKRSSRRIRRRIKARMTPECDIEQACSSIQDIKDGTEHCIPLEEVWESLGMKRPVITYEGD